MNLILSATLPIFIYLSIDYFFEFHIAVILTVVYGLIEFIYYYKKEKRIDKLILISTFLVVVMGIVSYFLNSPSFFKLKPAILQLLAVAFLLYFVITKKSIFSIMKDRFKNMEVGKEQELFMQTVTRDTSILLFFHSLYIIYAAYYLSTAQWAFISGVLPYILLLGLMFVRSYFFRKKLKRNEQSLINQTIINNSIRNRINKQ